MTDVGYVVNAFGKRSADTPFCAFKILRGHSGPNDVELDIHFCGISQWDAQFAFDRALEGGGSEVEADDVLHAVRLTRPSVTSTQMTSSP